ncbi:MAG: hypothetical protein ACXVPQ_09490 [Bacteroidia bacterium]
MRVFAFIGIVVSIVMLILMNYIYTPLMDLSTTSTAQRLLMTITMIFGLYFLFFSVKVSVKAGSLIKWVPEEEESPVKKMN